MTARRQGRFRRERAFESIEGRQACWRIDHVGRTLRITLLREEGEDATAPTA